MCNNLNYIRFDVGHHLYVCHKSTIMKYEDSVLAKYIAPHFDKRKSEFDYIVIDRDGKHFGSILNYMRDQTSVNLSQWTDNDLTDLMREADYYCLVSLLQDCEREFELRTQPIHQEPEQEPSFAIPPGHELKIIFGLDVMLSILEESTKPTIVISYLSMRKLHIDSWIEELVKLCDYKRFNVYCFANKDVAIDSTTQSSNVYSQHNCIVQPHGAALNNFIMSLYDPEERRFLSVVLAPAYEKFRAKRAHYKCKIFKFWFLIQNDIITAKQTLTK